MPLGDISAYAGPTSRTAYERRRTPPSLGVVALQVLSLIPFLGFVFVLAAMDGAGAIAPGTPGVRNPTDGAQDVLLVHPPAFGVSSHSSGII